jgi:hypothetical protein
MWIMAVLVMTAAPALAEDCFAGKPRHVTYDDGHVITVIQRHGDDLTYTTPYEGFQDSVHKTHLMLFPKQSRQGARATEFRWTQALPKLDDLVPGYHFDLTGTMKSGEGDALPYRSEGEVLGTEAVMVGDCSYDAAVIRLDTYLNDELLITAKTYLSLDMMMVLKSEFVPISAGAKSAYTAVLLQ